MSLETRSRTSGEKDVLRFVMAPSSQELEPPGNPARFSQPRPADALRLKPCAGSALSKVQLRQLMPSANRQVDVVVQLCGSLFVVLGRQASISWMS
jgi:hypothetical protein